MVPYSWNKEGLKMFRVAENIQTLLVNRMEKQEVMLCADDEELD